MKKVNFHRAFPMDPLHFPIFPASALRKFLGSLQRGVKNWRAGPEAENGTLKIFPNWDAFPGASTSDPPFLTALFFAKNENFYRATPDFCKTVKKMSKMAKFGQNYKGVFSKNAP